MERDEKLKETQNESVSYFKSIIKPSDDELKKHKQFLKTNLKKNFFS